MPQPTDEKIIIDDHGRILNDPTHAAPVEHGNSPAAWALVVLVLIGSVVGAVALLAGQIWLIWVGGVIAVAGLIVGFVMRQMGYGVGGSKTNSSH